MCWNHCADVVNGSLEPRAPRSSRLPTGAAITTHCNTRRGGGGGVLTRQVPSIEEQAKDASCSNEWQVAWPNARGASFQAAGPSRHATQARARRSSVQTYRDIHISSWVCACVEAAQTARGMSAICEHGIVIVGRLIRPAFLNAWLGSARLTLTKSTPPAASATRADVLRWGGEPTASFQATKRVPSAATCRQNQPVWRGGKG